MVGFIGRLTEQKGVDLILSAVAALLSPPPPPSPLPLGSRSCPESYSHWQRLLT